MPALRPMHFQVMEIADIWAIRDRGKVILETKEAAQMSSLFG